MIRKSGATVAAKPILTEVTAKWIHHLAGAFTFCGQTPRPSRSLLRDDKGQEAPRMKMRSILFFFTREVLDSPLSFHCGDTVRLGFEIDDFCRAAAR
jgi:hypothetical protein